jgi:hypothetical protein
MNGKFSLVLSGETFFNKTDFCCSQKSMWIEENAPTNLLIPFYIDGLFVLFV